MFKICRNIVFPRWSNNKQPYVENNYFSSHLSQRVLSSQSYENNWNSNQSHQKKQFNQNERSWNCESFKWFLFKTSIIEKAGWLGAATILCFNVHVKHFHSMHGFERRNAHCIFSKDVLAMPQCIKRQETILPQVTIPQCVQKRENILPPDRSAENSTYNKPKNAQLPDVLNILDNLRQITSQYTSAVHNTNGLSTLKSNAKKAFRYFQAAARGGSSQGFYNLGLCYELGKGTKINLTRAAFCYKKAALKGHGLASFNLAVYFLKGLGGVPIDHEIAKILLSAAAEKDVPEAQLYIGLEYLENKKWFEAFRIFNELAKKNMLDGKYYLGLCYENGWGVHKDENIASELFAQAALNGHAKSVLKLSKYYEEGIRGCNPDLDFSEALSQIIADQGSEEGKSSVKRLKEKRGILFNKESVNKPLPSAKSEKVMHNSSSVPELSSYQNAKTEHKAFVDQSYLGLITPFISIKTMFKTNQTTFTIGNEKLELNLTNSLVPRFQIYMHKLMTAKS